MFKMMSKVRKMFDEMFRAYDEAYMEAVKNGDLGWRVRYNAATM